MLRSTLGCGWHYMMNLYAPMLPLPWHQKLRVGVKKKAVFANSIVGVSADAETRKR